MINEAILHIETTLALDRAALHLMCTAEADGALWIRLAPTRVSIYV